MHGAGLRWGSCCWRRLQWQGMEGCAEKTRQEKQTRGDEQSGQKATLALGFCGTAGINQPSRKTNGGLRALAVQLVPAGSFWCWKGGGAKRREEKRDSNPLRVCSGHGGDAYCIEGAEVVEVVASCSVHD